MFEAHPLVLPSSSALLSQVSTYMIAQKRATISHTHLHTHTGFLIHLNTLHSRWIIGNKVHDTENNRRTGDGKLKKEEGGGRETAGRK